jgi:lipoate-protein ligase A
MPSVRDEVLNIASLLPYDMDINQFSEKLVTWLLAYYPESNAYEMNQDEFDAIHQLAETKYKTWQWNFGYSPAYSFSVRIPLLSGIAPAVAKVENGRFVQIDQPLGNNDPQLTEILQSMIGLLHNEDEIKLFVEKNIKTLELAGVNSVYYTESFFQ